MIGRKLIKYACLALLGCDAATAATAAAATTSELSGIPTVPFLPSSKIASSFNISSIRSITIDLHHANDVDSAGWTLIPPTLEQFADTFAEDLSAATGRRIPVRKGDCTTGSDIFLTIGKDDGFKDAAGRFTAEGYRIDVDGSGIVLTGASPLGVWWGTRTVLQQVSLNKGTLRQGSGVDAPGWNTRGVFLDAGRHFYPPDFIVEMCNWISYWKQNTFHLHLSDNLYNNVDLYGRERQLELYARFRPWSDDPAVAGLNKHRNESYTRQDFDHMQTKCAARGVTIIPEIEAPGHALVISQWKPELGLDGALDLLNISYPDTIPTMETVWNTFLPWFHSKVVHIGADEYVDSALSKYELAENYNHFVNAMNAYIAKSGKEIRIWGTYPPQSNYTNNIAKNVTVQHWEYFEDNPLFDYINNGYSVINSDDAFYMVQKYSTSYPQQLNRTRIFHGDPAGGPYAPNIFDTKNSTNNPPRDSKYVPGHIAAQWNDYGYNTSTYLEAYYEWRNLLPALADKQWGGNLQDGDYDALFAALQPLVPAQNLDRVIKSRSSTILQYDFSSRSSGQSGRVRDGSGNGYDGETQCKISGGEIQLARSCALRTPLTSKGSDYTLSFTVKQSSNATGSMFSGPDSELRSGNGTSTAVMMVSGGNAFALNYSLPVGRWVDARLIGRGNQTFFSADGGPEMEFTTSIGVNGERHVSCRMAIVAPLRKVGGGSWEGAMKNITLVDHA